MKLKTFVERMTAYHLERDKPKIIEDLRQLAANRTLLSEHLYSTIQQQGFSTKSSLYNAYAFVLHSNDVFTVRLGFWAPVLSQDERETFIYDLNHSHDFEIYAVGYCGDGYTTVTRTILDKTPIKMGIKPRLGEERILKLAPGEVMHMLPLKEVHKQLPPQRMSASLSVIIHPPRTTKAEEAWCFDDNHVPTYPGIATQETALYEETLSLLNRE
ncbi:transposase [Pseudomonas frederiksbergensis]|uniref:Transposase n=1 Tax=Pseudomonas frederiksbergensis TaxID=104087 RepID=A0A423JY45_9PSED|nr:transposase [Pseudomonas frederiksbergensis]RON42597.1 transposase [Pseudomonas frederiksbergensis]